MFFPVVTGGLKAVVNEPGRVGIYLPTLRDVAVLAGVSTATVSHVINRTRRTTQETRERVELAIRKLGFVPNAAGRISGWSVEPGEPTGAGLGGAVEVAADEFLARVVGREK